MNKVFTIGYIGERVSYPCIRIGGRWLKQFGFEIGDKIQVNITNDKLQIEKITNKEKEEKKK